MKQLIFAAVLILAGCFAVSAQTVNNKCPEINFVSPKEIIIPASSTLFVVEVGGDEKRNDLQYEWTFSVGKILSGQGTSRLEYIASEEYNGSNITVSVKINGLPENCSDTRSDTYGIAALPIIEPLDDFGRVSSNEYKTRIDSFLFTVANNPNSEGLINQMFDKKATRKYKISLLKSIIKFLSFRKFDLTKISFAISREETEERTLFWVTLAGGKYPKYIETDCETIKAEELEKKLKELFPKNK